MHSPTFPRRLRKGVQYSNPIDGAAINYEGVPSKKCYGDPSPSDLQRAIGGRYLPTTVL